MTTTAPSTLVPGAVAPAHRLSFPEHAPKVYKAMAALNQAIELDPVLNELVKLRASVINGCSYCVDLHTRDMVEAGEDPRRIAAVSAWHHAPFFTAKERVTLALTDAVTRLGDHGVPDALWSEVREHFDEDEAAQLLAAIIMINAWNRLAVPLESLPHDVARELGR
jgi:AhpD family alkylhydroperoxidase